MKVLAVIGVIALLPMLALAQQSQLPQPRKPGKWCPEGWSANGNFVCRASTRRGRQFSRTVGVRSDGARVAVIAFAEGPQRRASLHRRHSQMMARRPAARLSA